MNNHSKKILIVEDAPELLKVWTMLFKNFTEFNIRSTTNAATALSWVEDGYAPDVIVSDYYLGEGNGVSLINDLKDTLPHIIAILVTGNDEDETIVKLSEEGTLDLLVKPVRFPDLKDLISERLLQTSASSAKKYLLHEKTIDDF